ncbi:MAG: hypothetical protein OEM78_05920, partial [Gammaproteobacteria bacterium]|nr:hypothetical protein [Gammaproteobacteria bacterium]
AWPGELTLTVAAAGAQFTQSWEVHAEDWLALPGNAEHWPANVTLDGVPAAVVERNGQPALRVAPGSHEIAGSLTWTQRPASVAIPAQTVLVSLSVDGERIARPQIERGTLWLGLIPEAAVEEDRLNVVVYRLVTDGIPVSSVTEIQLDVAGQSREIELTGALLAGFVGERLQSILPVQLDANGTLRVQVRPGDWRVRLTSHAETFVTEIALPEASAPWPDDEIWSFSADTRLRVAVLEGAPPIDALATGVPGDWQGMPSYSVAAGMTLALTERSRNDADEANRLMLGRQLWLDFSGDGFTTLDAVSGELSSGWRLDMAAPYVMTMATRDLGNPTPANNLLITEGEGEGVQGIELRTTRPSIQTTSRVGAGGALPVTGYLDAFDTVNTTLNLPPGYRLLAAPGADSVVGAWLNDWRLLDLFLALIVATATWRLLGVGPGLLAALTMVLVFHEPAAPRWAWLNLLVAIGLLGVAPEGRLRRFASTYRNASLAALVLLLVPFTTIQLKNFVFPQLERPVLVRSGMLPGRFQSAPMQRMPEAATLGAVATDVIDELIDRPGEFEEAVVRSRAPAEDPSPSRYLPGTLVQTGPGLPDWVWTRAQLNWTSPVEPGQNYRLVIAGPASVAAWRLASVLAALSLLWFLARGVIRLPAGMLRGGGQAAAMLVGALLLTPEPGQAQVSSDFPSPDLLAELKARLTEPAPCQPRCAELTSAAAEISGDVLTVELQFANQADVAVPLPGTAQGWRADTVTVDGAAAAELYADNAQRYWLALTEGVHSVQLSGLLPAANSVTIPFPLNPRAITVLSPGWDVAGLADGHLPSGALELVRQQQDEAGEEELGVTEFPPFVRVTRRIEFGLEWSVRTIVQRIAPSDSAFTLEIPLLGEEAVLTPGIEVADGSATAAFAAGVFNVSWESRLPTAANLTLASANDAPWVEHWVFSVGPLWHAEFAGIPRAPSSLAEFSLEYLPRPGETLTANLTRPEPAGGDTIAIDEVDYTASVGERLTQSNLSFTYRSTRAEQHILTLPEGSELDNVTIDGRVLPLRLDGNQLELPVTTGEHAVEITWRNAREIGTIERLDSVDLGAGASNLRASLNLPRDRWVLWSFGPRLGSAILYWSELLVFAVAAFVLGRLAWSPLRTHEWLLLGLGLSTFAWPTLLLFAAWAFAMSWRERIKRKLGDRAFNGMQLGLGLLTITALAALLGAIPTGLLGAPDMQIVSPVGFGQLSWFSDRSSGLTPGAGAISVSLWFYRGAMLAWALWLSFALLRWLPWAWRSYNTGGLWRGKVAAEA